MKTTLFLAIVLLLFAFENRPPEILAARYDSIIVFKVDGLAGERYQRISTAFGSDADASIEYACLWSGVMVVKLFNSSISNKGDAQMYIRTRIGGASPGSIVEFLHVYIEQSSGSTKC